MQVSQAFGLGFGEPTPGLMDRKPRPAGVPILGRQMLTWLAHRRPHRRRRDAGGHRVGHREFDETVGPHRMGFVTFAFFNIAFSLATKDETKSSLSREVIADRTFADRHGHLRDHHHRWPPSWDCCSGSWARSASALEQWILCLIVGVAILPIAEVRKLSLEDPGRRGPKSERAAATADS